MNKEDKVFELATKLFIKKATPSYLNDVNEKFYRDMAKDSVKVATLFMEEYEKKDSSNPPEDEL